MQQVKYLLIDLHRSLQFKCGICYFSSVLEALSACEKIETSVDEFKRSVKCSLTNENSHDVAEFKVDVADFESMLFEWKMVKSECSRHLTAVTIRVRREEDLSDLLLLNVTRDCLRFTDDVFSIRFPSTSGNCTVPMIQLSECGVYTAQVTPEFHTFNGLMSQAKFVVAPKVNRHNRQQSAFEN